MTEFLRLAVLFIAAVNPAAAALAMATGAERTSGRPRWHISAVGIAVAAACFVVAAVFATHILNGLAIEPESFRIAAGGVMAMVGAQVIWRGKAASMPPDLKNFFKSRLLLVYIRSEGQVATARGRPDVYQSRTPVHPARHPRPDGCQGTALL